MDNQKWLFPEFAESIIENNNKLLLEQYSGRILSHKELVFYSEDLFPVGWRAFIETSKDTFAVDILLSSNTPFSEPRIALVDKNYFLQWAHVENKGLLCLRQGEDSLIHSSSSEITKYYLSEAIKLIEENLIGHNKDDFITEFNSYWSYWCNRKRIQSTKVLFFSKPEPPSRFVYYFNLDKTIFVCDSVEEGMKWLREYKNKLDFTEKDFTQGIYFWLNYPLTPSLYPKSNLTVAPLVRKIGEDEYRLLNHIVPSEPESINVFFGFDSGNGPALGGLILNEPVEFQPPKQKKIFTRFKGFRKRTTAKSVANGYFTANGKTEALSVQRIDYEWLFERGGTGIKSEMKNAKVCIIGCGSLGAHITKMMSQSGVSNFVLIDDDTLSWDNVGRHLSGGIDTDKPKVKGLKQNIENHFPGITHIHVENDTWEKVYRKDPTIITDCSLIISTIGNWDSEAALNHMFNTNDEFPPVVYGWAEPYSMAGHALAIQNLGGCFACGMDSFGHFKRAITKWDKSITTKRAPACGISYQPYAITDIAPIQTMITRLSLDILLGNVKYSQHRAWFGDLSVLAHIGGELYDNIYKYYNDFGDGNRYIIKKWKIQQDCRYGH